jgi:hypothetical protein
MSKCACPACLSALLDQADRGDWPAQDCPGWTDPEP